MNSLILRTLTATALLAVAATTISSTWAQQPQTMRIRGTVEKVDGNTVVVKATDGASVTLTLTDKAVIVGVVKASLAEIKEGSYVGSAAMPQADGSQKALEVHIFAESQRGTGEGHRPFTVPNSTMTNGTVGATVTATDGHSLTVKYAGGEKKIGRALRDWRPRRAQAGRSHHGAQRGEEGGRIDRGPAAQCRPRRPCAAVGDRISVS